MTVQWKQGLALGWMIWGRLLLSLFLGLLDGCGLLSARSASVRFPEQWKPHDSCWISASKA